MATTAKTSTSAPPRGLAAEVAFLTRALKAPTLRESVPRLADRARTEGWSHEEFLVACLQREVAARESHGGEGRIRAAGCRRARASRSSTSATPAASHAMSSRIWAPWTCPGIYLTHDYARFCAALGDAQHVSST
jgi:hypothetical protein